MHRYLQTSGLPPFLFGRPVAFGKECQILSDNFQATLTPPGAEVPTESSTFTRTAFSSYTNKPGIPYLHLHITVQEKQSHILQVFCTWKHGQIQRYIHKITKLLTQDMGLGFWAQPSQSWNDLLCSRPRETWGCLAFTEPCTVLFTCEVQQTLGPDHTGEITIAIISYDNR